MLFSHRMNIICQHCGTSMPNGICCIQHIPIGNVNFSKVVGCDVARNVDPLNNPDGKCDHWIPAPHPREDMDNPTMAAKLLDHEGVIGAVNCYPGKPSECHCDCYIFVDWVSDPWKCLQQQIQLCEETQHIYLIGSWESLKRHQMRGRKIKHWLSGVSMFRPSLLSVQARESSLYPGGRLEHLGPFP